MKTCKLLEARENANDYVAVVFSFVSDRLRGWREVSEPITEKNKVKLKQSWITFDSQLKTALIIVHAVINTHRIPVL